MTMDDLDAEIAFLMGKLEVKSDDVHEVYFRLRQILDTFRAEGMPVPDNLAKLEKDLDARFTEEGKG